LREIGHPITLFGEGPAERRDRLRDLLSERVGAGEEVESEGEEGEEEVSEIKTSRVIEWDVTVSRK
jgi:U4/U6 small nuclear ribonucleoprotein PRP4